MGQVLAANILITSDKIYSHSAGLRIDAIYILLTLHEPVSTRKEPAYGYIAMVSADCSSSPSGESTKGTLVISANFWLSNIPEVCRR